VLEVPQNIFQQVLQNSSLLIEKINAKETEDLQLLYQDDAVMEIIGLSKFVGIEQIQLFWSALVFDLKSEIAYRDVSMEILSDDAMSMSAILTASAYRFIGFAMNESWVRNKGSWRISGCQLQVRSASVAAIDSFLVFVQIFSTSLQNWLNGQDVTEDNWSRIADACADELGVVLPDGRKISGVELLALIRDLVASEPSLVMEVSQLEMLTMSESLCVVTYVESRRLSGEVGTEDVRSTLAFARHSSAGWAWRHVQQTSTELR
jgi:hypothetical protein